MNYKINIYIQVPSRCWTRKNEDLTTHLINSIELEINSDNFHFYRQRESSRLKKSRARNSWNHFISLNNHKIFLKLLHSPTPRASTTHLQIQNYCSVCLSSCSFVLRIKETTSLHHVSLGSAVEQAPMEIKANCSDNKQIISNRCCYCYSETSLIMHNFDWISCCLLFPQQYSKQTDKQELEWTWNWFPLTC